MKPKYQDWGDGQNNTHKTSESTTASLKLFPKIPAINNILEIYPITVIIETHEICGNNDQEAHKI